MFKNKLNLILIIVIAVVLTATGIMAGMIISRNNDAKKNSDIPGTGSKNTAVTNDIITDDSEEDDLVISDVSKTVSYDEFKKWVIGEIDTEALEGMSRALALDENLIKAGYNSKGEICKRLGVDECGLLFDYTSSESDLLCSGDYEKMYNEKLPDGESLMASFGGCFYNSEKEEIQVYVSVFKSDGTYMHSDVWAIYPYDGQYSFGINGIERLYMNTTAKARSTDDKSEAPLWEAFCADLDSEKSVGTSIYGVGAKREDGSVISAKDVYEETGHFENYYITKDVQYLDYDNDGEIEVLIGAKWYNYYGGICFDFKDDGMYVLAEGNGSAVTLATTWYENAMWISYSDSSHWGRSSYYLTKYGDGGNVVDEISLYAEAQGDLADEYLYLYNDTGISEEEYDEYLNKIYYRDVAQIADGGLYNIVRNPELSDCRNAYSEQIEKYYAEHRDSESNWSKVRFGFIYLDDDDIPELVCGLDGYHVSVFRYKDGYVDCIMDCWPYGAMGNSGYDYYPRTGVVTNTNSDYAGLVVYYSFIKYDPEKSSLDECDGEYVCSSMVRDENGNGFYDEINWDDEAYGEDDEWYYYDAGQNEITQEEFDSYFSKYDGEPDGITGKYEYNYIIKKVGN